MPSLASHQSNDFVKLLLLGDAKSGKTASLVSLVEAGYKLRILDMDNLLDFLKNKILEKCPDKINNVEFRTLRDKYRTTEAGLVLDGQPKAFITAMKMLDRWKYKDDEENEIDYGVPSTWGGDCILVVDSLSRLCDSAYDYRVPLTPVGSSGLYDARAVYGDAQDAIETCLAGLTSKSFATNIIVICHGIYMDNPDGTKKIFPQGVGQKLSPKIPQYFPNYLRFKNEGGKRTIHTVGDTTIDLAITKSIGISKSYPSETGLATIFEALRGPLKQKPQLKAVDRR